MAYIRIECSVPRNRKFVKAGPAPAWLWLCGLAYCQEGLTDGFIPSEALPYLGVKNAAQLADHLVKAGLWDVAEGGWNVHDYLEHNRSAVEVADVKAKRAVGGKLGGRPKKNLHETSKVSHMETLQETFPVAVVADASVVVSSSSEGSLRGDPPMDAWARELVNLYPAQGRCGWNLVERPLFMALTGNGGDPWETWDILRAALEGHKRSHQWRVKQMIPRLDKWLREGLYLQELPETPVTSLVNERNARTLSSAAEFIKAGERGTH